jgi:hypothetical protein
MASLLANAFATVWGWRADPDMLLSCGGCWLAGAGGVQDGGETATSASLMLPQQAA